MLKVYGRRNSSNVQKVMWLIGELDIPHEHIPAGGSFGGLDSPEFLSMNPQGKVPVIDDGGTVIWESHTILRYLAAKHGTPKFYSNDPAERAGYERWMDWSQCKLDRDFISGVFWGYYRAPEDQRDMDKVNIHIENCAAHMRLLDGVLEDQAYLGGDKFGLADIPAGSNLYRYFNLDIERPDVPNVERWYRSLTERPAFQEHVMLDFSELKGRLAF